MRTTGDICLDLRAGWTSPHNCFAYLMGTDHDNAYVSPLHCLSERLEPTFQSNSEPLHGAYELCEPILTSLFFNLKIYILTVFIINVMHI